MQNILKNLIVVLNRDDFKELLCIEYAHKSAFLAHKTKPLIAICSDQIDSVGTIIKVNIIFKPHLYKNKGVQPIGWRNSF